MSQDRSAPVLSLRDVCKTFPSKQGPVQALADINLDIARGEVVCVLGPSGGGKTTLLNLMAGLELPSEGQVSCNGAPVTGPGPDRVVIFQELALFPWLTVLGNVTFGLKMKGVDRHDRKRRAVAALDLVHLGDFKRSFIHQLSGGMKQRVAFARALVMEPSILLLDEPFGALDPETKDVLLAEVQEIIAKTGSTIVFVTHNVREAVTLGDRVILLSSHPGRVKRDYRVELPRPRKIDDAGVVDLAEIILADLRGAGRNGNGSHP